MICVGFCLLVIFTVTWVVLLIWVDLLAGLALVGRVGFMLVLLFMHLGLPLRLFGGRAPLC